MRDAVICEPIRTPVGGLGGTLARVPVQALAAHVIRTLVERTGVDPDRIDDVVLGQGYANGEAPALGRVAALDAGLPVTVPGVQVDRRCGAGLQAVLDAAMRVQTGAADVVVAGGAESMSQVEHYVLGARAGLRAGTEFHDRLARGRVTAGGEHHPVPGGMVETAENLRAEFGITREAQDRLALRSHEKAVAAQDAGRFDDELVPVEVPGRRGSVTVVDRDEHPRPDTSLETLAGLRPVRGRVDPDATVTAGNASGQNDGAAVCLVVAAETADQLGLRPMARLVSWGLAGVEPSRMGLGPVDATTRALGRAGIELRDVDVLELNEAFAAQVLAVLASWGLDAEDERLNPNGSGISLGHPIGATGGRLLATGLRELERREGRYLLETMCIGGGQGLAAVFERIG
ncbi:acetyl-CoA C-acetyltransferase [Nitriliruptoraceae bacterium ZYF776]|nr:acetyl-CoA C-acetyltransferase [Profundirhabdus halotolerans]